MAWTIRACFGEWSLGGNQIPDKYRMVPPFCFTQSENEKQILCFDEHNDVAHQYEFHFLQWR